MDMYTFELALIQTSFAAYPAGVPQIFKKESISFSMMGINVKANRSLHKYTFSDVSLASGYLQCFSEKICSSGYYYSTTIITSSNNIFYCLLKYFSKLWCNSCHHLSIYQQKRIYIYILQSSLPSW